MNTQGSSRQNTSEEGKSIASESIKLSVMREEQVALKGAKENLEKDVARLELKIDALSGDASRLEAVVEAGEEEAKRVTKNVEELKVTFGDVDAELVVARKALKEAEKLTLEESVKLAAIVSQAREAQSGLDARMEAVKAAEQATEERKARITAILVTL